MKRRRELHPLEVSALRLAAVVRRAARAVRRFIESRRNER